MTVGQRILLAGCIALAVILIAVPACASGAPEILWQKCLGGARYGGCAGEGAASIQVTDDGGFIIGGYTDSPNAGDVTGIHYNPYVPPEDMWMAYPDIWMVKLRGGGSMDWQQCLGGSWFDMPGSETSMELGYQCIRQTSDGGYIVAGCTDSCDGDIHPNPGDDPGNVTLTWGWIVKYRYGVAWEKRLDKEGVRSVRAIAQTSDGGYIAAGEKYRTIPLTGGYDAWVGKLSDNGTLEWSFNYQSGPLCCFESILQTQGGDYVAAGHSGEHAFAVKLDRKGHLLHMVSCGESGTYSSFRSIAPASGGHYIATGFTGGAWPSASWDTECDLYVVEFDKNLFIVNQRTIGGSRLDRGNSVIQASDGGYILVGETASKDGDVKGLHTGAPGEGTYYLYNGPFTDAWVIRLDRHLNIVWQRCLGGSHHDRGNSVVVAPDGGYVIAGSTRSIDGDVVGYYPGTSAPSLYADDMWVVKLYPEGAPKILWISLDPVIPVTGEHITCTADVTKANDWEVSGFSWYLYDCGKTNSSVGAMVDHQGGMNDPLNPYSFSVPYLEYGNKSVVCTLYARNKKTGTVAQCDEEVLDFKVFFKMGTHPNWVTDPPYLSKKSSSLPNWYLYWVWDGAVDGLKDFEYNAYMGGGAYLPGSPDKYYIGPDGAGSDPPMPLTLKFQSNGTLYRKVVLNGQEGLELAAAVVVHEKRHAAIYHEWDPGNRFHGLADSDRLGYYNDHLPDEFERGNLTTSWGSGGFTHVTDVNTYVFLADNYHLYGDNELYARLAQADARTVMHPGRDWSDRGSMAHEQQIRLTPFVIGTGFSVSSADSGEDAVTLQTDGYTGTPGFDPAITESGVDTNGNGLFDLIAVTTDLRVNTTAFYTVDGWLNDSANNTAARVHWGEHLEPGVYPLTLNFSGTEISRHGTGGPYILSLVLSWGGIEISELVSGESVLTTQAYSLSEFEGSQIALAGCYADAGIDANGDGIYDSLTLTVATSVATAGNYSVTASLYNGSRFITETSETILLAPGERSVSLPFSGPAIGFSELDGPYNVSHVRITDERGIILDYAPAPYITGPYLSARFRPTALTLTNVSDTGTDTDGDGKYNWLRIDLTLNVSKAGFYTFSGSLLDPGGGRVAGVDKTAELRTGRQQVRLDVAGEVIRDHRVNGPYALAPLLVTGADGEPVLLNRSAHTTGPYQFDRFEGLSFNLTGEHSDHGVDTDEDGLYDSLEVTFGLCAGQEGDYVVSAAMEAPGGREAGEAYRNETFTADETRAVTLTFTGTAISSAGGSGKYSLRGVTVYSPDTGDSCFIPDTISTKTYDSTQFERVGAVSGTVTTDEGWPVRGAYVGIEGTGWTATDSLGRYHLEVYPGGTCLVQVETPAGYCLSNASATVAVEEGAEAVQDFVLRPAGGEAPDILTFTPRGGDPVTQVSFSFRARNITGEPTVILNRTGYPAITGNITAIFHSYWTPEIVEASGTLNLTGAAPGVWDVVVLNPSGRPWISRGAFRVYYPSIAPPVANFTANVTSGIPPLAVQFNDTSTGNPTRWQWSFIYGAPYGDTSSEQDPVYTYTVKDTSYTVELVVENEGGINTTRKNNFVRTTAIPPVANFTAYPLSLYAPASVSFKDLSEGSPSYWFWDFGDGTNSTVQNPYHTFTGTGVYTVTLVAGNSGGNTTTARDVRMNWNSIVPSFGVENSTVSFWMQGRNPLPATEVSLTRGAGTIQASGLSYTAYGLSGRFAIPPGTEAGFWNVTVRQGDHVYESGLRFQVLEGSMPTAPGWIFRGDKRHTGVYDDGGILPANRSLWRFATDGPVRSTPAIVDDTVYIGSDDGNVYAIDALTGERLWDFATGGVVNATPAVCYGTVYIGSGDGHMYALDSSTGAERWDVDTGSGISSSPVVHDGIVYVGNDAGSFFALYASEGEILWTDSVGGAFRSSPAAVDQRVFVGCEDGNLYQLFDTGWWGPLSYLGGMITTSPVVEDVTVHIDDPEYPGDPEHGYDEQRLVVFVGDLFGDLYGFDVWESSDVWSLGLGGALRSSPAVAGNVIYAGCDNGYLYALDIRSETLIWQYATGGPVRSSPAVAGDRVYVGSDDGTLYALDRQSGESVWSLVTGGPVVSSPAVASGIVYVGSDDGCVYAIGGTGVSAPVAAFFANVTAGTAPLDVQFEDQSTGSPTEWLWYFDDGNSSALRNPSHTYSEPGTYSVSLRVSNAAGSNTTTKEDYIMVTGSEAACRIAVLPGSSALKVGDTADYRVVLEHALQELSGYNLTVMLTDGSAGEIIGVTFPAWASLPANGSLPADAVWCRAVDLGGASGAVDITLVTLSVRADAAGMMNITVVPDRVEDRHGGRYSPSITPAEVFIDQSPEAAFEGNPTSGPAPLTVRFTDLSTCSPAGWNWTFGDGGASTESHPVHTYTAPGTYTVNLTVSNNDGSSTLSRPDYITVTGIKGDFNGDGTVDIGDVARVAYMVVGKIQADPAADFNGNGAVDIGDAAKIAYFFVGKIEAL